MKVLIDCEYSGIVRDAFSRRGWDAWSCDLLPTESELTRKEGKHIQGDAIAAAYNQRWDLLIAHPPCTFLSYAGTNLWSQENRVVQRINAAKFFMDMWMAPIEHIGLENPQGVMSNIFRKPDQTIHPYFFGDREMKRTCLWLKNLPPLKYYLEENLLFERTATDKPEPLSVDNTPRKKKRYFSDSSIRNPKERARFWPGIAEAMADQWTEYIINS